MGALLAPNVRDTVVILEDFNLPHPRCPLCDMLGLWRLLNVVHWCTAQYKEGAEQKQQRLAVKYYRAVTSSSFSAYRCPMEMLTSF